MISAYALWYFMEVMASLVPSISVPYPSRVVCEAAREGAAEFGQRTVVCMNDALEIDAWLVHRRYYEEVSGGL